MPKQYDYTNMERLISTARMTSYRNAFETNDKSELFGLYSWNLELAGTLNSFLQLIEVALRNTINEAGKKHIATNAGQHWFDNLPYNEIEDEEAEKQADGSYPKVKAEQVKKFEEGIKKAKKNAMTLLKRKLGDTTTATPTLDQIISQTDFSVWEYILDKSYYDGDATKGFLWPKGFVTAFKRLPPVTGKNKQFQQRDILRRRVESIRHLRNRVSHNEPTWKEGELSSVGDIITFLNAKVRDLLDLTYWISPDFNMFVKSSAVYHRLCALICEYEISNATYKNDPIDILSVENINQAIVKSGKQGLKVHIRSEALSAVVQAKNNRFN